MKKILSGIIFILAAALPRASAQAPAYTARTDRVIVQPVVPTPNMGDLVGAGICVTPATFNQTVCRITDSTFDPSHANYTLNTTSSGSGDINLWNTNSTLLTIQSEGSRLYPLAFNPATMQASRLYPTNPTYTAEGGFYLAIGGTAWSYANPMLLYTITGTLLQSYDFTGYNTGGNPPSPTTVYDFSVSSNCLGSSYSSTWVSFGETSKYPADQVFATAESNAGGQDTGSDVVAYKVGSGCSHLNTLTGAVTGDWGSTGTVGIPDRFYVHNVKISKDGQWAIVAQATCSVNPTITSISLTSNVVTAVLSSVTGLTVGSTIDVNGATPSFFNVSDTPLTAVNSGTNTVQWAQTHANASGSGGAVDDCVSELPYFWQIGTTNLYYSCTPGGNCGGHWTEGMAHFISGYNSPLGQEDIRPYGNDPVGTPILSGFPLPGCTDVQTDRHENWSNVDSADTYPYFESTAAVGANAQTPGSYNCAWVNEILGISSTTGTVYRFGHTYATGLNWSFDGQNAIGGVSQDGRFYAFTSDWQGTLGTEGGANGTCTNTPNSSTACRNDVFVVALARTPTAYYVDCVYGVDGNNTPGTAGSPWKTLARVNGFTTGQVYTVASGNTVVDAGFNPGDSLFLKRGCTWDWHLIIAPVTGTPPTASGNFNGTGGSSYFSIDAFGNGTPPTIQGEIPVSGWSCAADICHATVQSVSQGGGFNPSNLTSVKFGALWGTCKGGYINSGSLSATYCTGLAATGLKVQGLTASGGNAINFYSSSALSGSIVPGNTFTVAGDSTVYTVTNIVAAPISPLTYALTGVAFTPALAVNEANNAVVTAITTGENSATLAHNFDWYYSSHTTSCSSDCGTLYVYDSIGTNPTADLGAVAVALDGYTQLLNVSGISYVNVQHLKLLNFSWYGLEYGGSGDYVNVANTYADTEVPFNYHGIGFYFHPSNAAAHLTLLGDEAHRGYYGFEFAGGITAAVLSNSKAYFNRNAGLADMTANGTAVAYDHSHFYGNGIGGIGASDTTNSTGGAGGVAGAGNIATSTDPHVVGWNQYVPRVVLNYQGPGASPGSDTALNAQLTYLSTALGSVPPLSIGIATNYALSTSLISQFNTWTTAGYDLNSLGLSAASYANLGTFTVQYNQGGASAVLLTISGTPATLFKITVGGVTDFTYTITSSTTLSVLKAALILNTHYTVNWVQPCGSCAWVDGSAMLAQDLATISGQDVKTAAWSVPLNPNQFLADEMSLSKSWMMSNLTGLGSTRVYLYPGTLFNLGTAPWTESTALAAGYAGARGASNMQAGRDGVAGGYDGVAANGIDPQGLVAYSIAGWAALPPLALQAQIQETVEKSAVWGEPFVIYWSAGYITSAQLAAVVSDLDAAGATLMTNAGLVNFLVAKTALTSTIGSGLSDYAYAPDGAGPPQLGPTYRSPTLGLGANLNTVYGGTTYEYDLNGVPQPQTWVGKTGWDIGAQALVPIALGGLKPGH